jgi:hypothetical protein
MTCTIKQLETLPHTYTEGDRVPSVYAVYRGGIDLTAGWTVTAQVEKPDGTYFERVATIIDEQNARFDWLDTDWIKGCSRLTVQSKDPGGLDTTTDPVLVQTREKAGPV